VTEEKQQSPEDVLTDEILSDARRRAERTVKRAEREGKKTVDAAVKRAEAVRDRLLEVAQRRLDRDEQVFASSLALEERMRKLKTQGALLDEVFAKAAERLEAGGDFDGADLVRKLTVEAVLAMTGDAFVLRLAGTDLPAMRTTLPTEAAEAVKRTSSREVTLTCADESADIAGGVIVESADGAQHFDNSFTGRLARLKDKLRFEVAGMIFQDVDRETDAKDEE